MGDLIGLIAVLGGLSIPLLAVWTRHKRTMLEMQLMMRGQSNDNVTNAIEQLRAEVRNLRDTSTQYDLSFDSAMQRMERRVDLLERHAVSTRSANTETYETRVGG